VDAAGNNHAQRMLLRDVQNLNHFFGRFAPELLRSEHGDEIWDLFRRGVLHPAVTLSGRFRRDAAPADVNAVMREIDAARAEDAARRLRLQSVR